MEVKFDGEENGQNDPFNPSNADFFNQTPVYIFQHSRVASIR